MIRVKLEDGRIVEFPDDTPESLIKEKLQELTAPDLSAGEIPRPPEEEMEAVEREMPRFSPTRQRGRYAGRTQQEPEEEESISYTPETVLQDEEAMSVIRDYMYDFKGTSPQTSDEELVDQYLAQMRKFAAGQSVVTLNELNQLRKSDEDKLATAGKAYDVFDNFEGVFSEDYTWGETLGGLGTYARAAIVDPLNLAGYQQGWRKGWPENPNGRCYNHRRKKGSWCRRADSKGGPEGGYEQGFPWCCCIYCPSQPS